MFRHGRSGQAGVGGDVTGGSGLGTGEFPDDCDSRRVPETSGDGREMFVERGLESLIRWVERDAGAEAG